MNNVSSGTNDFAVATAAMATAAWPNELFGENHKFAVHPIGYQLLLRFPKQVEKTTGGIVIPETRQEIEEHRMMVGEVVSMGDEAYDMTRHSQHQFRRKSPWCKVGDWVMIPEYAGARRFRIDGHDELFVIVNEDTPLATVDDPNKVTRV